MPEIDVGNWRVRYDAYGDPTLPPVVLVHGMMSDAATVKPLAERLSGQFHVIAPDALGHGRTTHPASFTLEDQARMLAGLITALGHEQAALVGISMGSYIAAQTAILEPALVTKLALIVSKAHGATSSVAAFAARKGIDLSSLTSEEMLTVMAEAVWSPDTQARREAILASVSPPVPLSPQEQAAVEKSLAGFDLRPTLPSITAPTLVISGKDDGLNPPELGRELADHIPGSRFEVYQHSGHMLAAEEEGRLVADLAAFLRP